MEFMYIIRNNNRSQLRPKSPQMNSSNRIIRVRFRLAVSSRKTPREEMLDQGRSTISPYVYGCLTCHDKQVNAT